MKVDTPTIFVGVYGTLRVHPWIDPGRMEEDAYSLFVSRAVAMGWTSTGPNGLGPVLWGMHDAGQDWTEPDAARIAWFQVGAPEPAQIDAPLPVQPVMACVGDTLGRVGRVDLSAVQLLLPVHAAGPATAHLVSGLGWFGASDPAARVPVHLTLDGGEDDVVRPAAGDLLAALRRTRTGPFDVDAVLPAVPPVAPEPAVVGDLWLGAGRHPVTFACAVPEWSFDALGWLVALFAEACRAVGVRTPVLVSVGRPERKP